MIGDPWNDQMSTHIFTNDAAEYTTLTVTCRTRRPDGSGVPYNYDMFAYKNSWVHLVRRFTADREYGIWINGEKKYSVTIPADEKTILEWNPDTATYYDYYRRFVLEANVRFNECMKCMHAMLRIYNRALTQEEIRHNMYRWGSPVKDGLVLWLSETSINPPAWNDLSGYGNNGTIYGAIKVERPLTTARILTAARTLPTAR